MAKTQNQEQNKSALKPIIFYQGEENGIVVETNNYEYSIFEDQYKRAFQIFDRIVNKQQSCNKFYDKGNRGDVASSLSIEVDNQYSNIVAFCGDRGEGKSSCMSSFAAMLSKMGARAAAVKADLVSDKYVSFNDIELVDTIDPSSFDSTHNIIELLVGRMFYHIKMECFKQDDCEHPQYDYDQRLCKRSSLLKQFEKVKSSMAILNNKEIKYDSMEEVDDLAVGLRLKNEIEELFKQYLDYNGKKHLVLCIDDLDLNMTEGYKMAEMIRKYLVNPYCILLVAVKVDQLVNVIATAIEQETKGSQIITYVQCHHMAQKYVVKLLPQSNRIEMPNPMDLCEHPIVLYLDHKDIIDINDNDYVPLKEYIVRLIYQKTGYVFYNTQELSPIIPSNLRELRYLIGMLQNIVPDAVQYDNDGNKHDNEEGREKFIHYFFNVWASRLSLKDIDFATNLINHDDLSTVNKYVIEHFCDRVKSIGLLEGADLKDDYIELYNIIARKSNVSANLSVGDVLYVLWCVDKITTNINIKNLIFLIRTFYSIRLYGCYNNISQSEKTLFPNSESLEHIDVTIHKSDKLYEGVNAIQRLLNGSLFTYPQNSLIQPHIESNIKMPRDIKIVDLNPIKNVFNNLYGKYQAAQKSSSNKDYTQELLICEFLALCIARTTAKDKDINSNRLETYPTFLGEISENANYAVFDFLLPFYSLCNVKYAYERFNSILNATKKQEQPQSDLYKIATENSESLLSQMLKKVRPSSISTSWDKMHNLISDAVIRVVDIQSAILDILVFRRDKNKSSSDEIYKISKAYDEIQKLGIKLYPRLKDLAKRDAEEKEKQEGYGHLHEINFEFLKQINKCLNMIGKELEPLLKDHVGATALKGIQDANIRLGAALISLKFPLTGQEISATITTYLGYRGPQKTSLTKRLNKILGKEQLYNSREEVLPLLALYLDQYNEF